MLQDTGGIESGIVNIASGCHYGFPTHCRSFRLAPGFMLRFSLQA